MKKGQRTVQQRLTSDELAKAAITVPYDSIQFVDVCHRHASAHTAQRRVSWQWRLRRRLPKHML